MKTPTRNILILVVALSVAGGALAFIALGMGKLSENLVYYWSPGEVLAHGEKAYGPTIRMGGLVKTGSIQWDEKATKLVFDVAEDRTPEAKTVKVVSTELPPQMFKEGIGVVVEGTYASDGVFTSSRLMVNHSNEYRAPKPGEDHKDEWKETLEGGDKQASREKAP